MYCGDAYTVRVLFFARVCFDGRSAQSYGHFVYLFVNTTLQFTTSLINFPRESRSIYNLFIRNCISIAATVVSVNVAGALSTLMPVHSLLWAPALGAAMIYRRGVRRSFSIINIVLSGGLHDESFVFQCARQVGWGHGPSGGGWQDVREFPKPELLLPSANLEIVRR